MLIRRLHDPADLAAIIGVQTAAQDYWHLAEGRCDPVAKARDFFRDGPPGADPARAQHLGLWDGAVLCGLAELSFGFPQTDDAYLGLMLIVPSRRGQGAGALFLRDIERRAGQAGAGALYLAVLAANPRARAFWERQGFGDTGVFADDPATGHRLHRLGKALFNKTVTKPKQ